MMMRRIESPSTGSATGRRQPEGGDEACLGRARQADKPKSPCSAPNYRRSGARISGARHHLAGPSCKVPGTPGWPLAPPRHPLWLVRYGTEYLPATACCPGGCSQASMLPLRRFATGSCSVLGRHLAAVRSAVGPSAACTSSATATAHPSILGSPSLSPSTGPVHCRERRQTSRPVIPLARFPRIACTTTARNQALAGLAILPLLRPWARSSCRLAGYDPRKPPGAAPVVAYQIPGLFYTAYYSAWVMYSPSDPAPSRLRGLAVAWITPDTSRPRTASRTAQLRSQLVSSSPRPPITRS